MNPFEKNKIREIARNPELRKRVMDAAVHIGTEAVESTGVVRFDEDGHVAGISKRGATMAVLRRGHTVRKVAKAAAATTRAEARDVAHGIVSGAYSAAAASEATPHGGVLDDISTTDLFIDTEPATEPSITNPTLLRSLRDRVAKRLYPSSGEQGLPFAPPTVADPNDPFVLNSGSRQAEPYQGDPRFQDLFPVSEAPTAPLSEDELNYSPFIRRSSGDPRFQGPFPAAGSTSGLPEHDRLPPYLSTPDY